MLCHDGVTLATLRTASVIGPEQGNQPMTRVAPVFGLAAGLAALAAASVAMAQGTAPPPQPAQPGMMGQMPGMQPHMQQRMMPGVQAPAATDPHQRGAAVPGPAAVSSSTAAFVAANETMHRDMAITYTGDADRDFAASMIPHHQGAIDMARVVLEHGRDPAVRAIANTVIREQQREIAELRATLARLPAR
jgi:hypothetical protein